MPITPLADPGSCALILAGAGTKGAFEAGAIDALLAQGHRFGTVVGSSSGGLNGALVASAIRAGRETELGAKLTSQWAQHTGFFDVFTPSLEGILGRRGFSNESKLLAMMESVAGPWLPGAAAPVRLVLVVTALLGRATEVGGRAATTYEYPVSFADADFDSPDKRGPLFNTALASGAIPVVFVPVELPAVGPCADGGLVNNTPIKHALADPAVTRIFVVVPYPSPVEPPPPRRGLDLVAHCFDIFIQERLHRDLKEAVQVNRELAAFDALAGDLPPEKLQALRTAMALDRKRPVEIVQVRPPETMAGNDLSGFTNSSLSVAQIESGRAAALAALALDPTTV